MEQKRIEERLEKFDQEIAGIQVKLHKLSAIEERLPSLTKTKSIERLDIQLEKQQLLLTCIKGTVKDSSTISGIMEGLSSGGPTIESIIEGGDTTLKEIKVEGKTNKSEGDENTNDLSKCKKVRACIVNG